MRKLIFSLICLFACAGLQARITLHQSDFDQKTPIEAFSENTPESHQVQKLYLIETASGELLILAENCASGEYRARYFDTDLGRFISRDPLGYVDGMGLYNGYFAQWQTMDPKGTEACKCGPDITGIFLRYIHKVLPYLREIRKKDSLTGLLDSLLVLKKIGMNIDFWYGADAGRVEGCATGKCVKTVWLAGRCVRETAPNNILFGFVASVLGADFIDATFGGNIADAEHDENTEQEGAYAIGYSIWSWVNEKTPVRADPRGQLFLKKKISPSGSPFKKTLIFFCC